MLYKISKIKYMRYLRIVLKAPVLRESWSNQIAGITVER